MVLLKEVTYLLVRYQLCCLRAYYVFFIMRISVVSSLHHEAYVLCVKLHLPMSNDFPASTIFLTISMHCELWKQFFTTMLTINDDKSDVSWLSKTGCRKLWTWSQRVVIKLRWLLLKHLATIHGAGWCRCTWWNWHWEFVQYSQV